jgi:phosphate transport system substrate-binding protein
MKIQNVALVLLGLLLTGCPAGKDSSADAAGSGDKVVIRGSNTFGEELGPRLITEYKKDHPNVTFDLESKGTGYGFGNLLAGGCNIAAASRSASSGELGLAKDRDIEMNEYVIGAYSVAVIVSANNPVANLTKQQVRDIFTGATKNWSEVGGPDAEIHLYVRDPISGTYLGFQELAMENKPYSLAPAPKTATNYLGIAMSVAKDNAGIGYVAVELATQPGIKGVSIDGAAPTIDAVKQSKYPYMRMVHFYTDKAKEPAQAKQFIDFVLSSSGQKVLDDMGYVPHP